MSDIGAGNLEIAAAWIDYWERHREDNKLDDQDPAIWALDTMSDLEFHDPLRALEISFLIARTTQDPWVLVLLGAGPLESLLSEDPTFFDAIASEASSSPQLVEALRSTWQNAMPDDVWRSVQRLAGSQ
jgi:uncharacterized protein DUF6869